MATTTERLQVGGGYTVHPLNYPSAKSWVELISIDYHSFTFKNKRAVFSRCKRSILCIAESTFSTMRSNGYFGMVLLLTLRTSLHVVVI